MNYGTWGSVGIITDQGAVDTAEVITGVSGNFMFLVYSRQEHKSPVLAPSLTPDTFILYRKDVSYTNLTFCIIQGLNKHTYY
jgi:hypothetical protein